MRSFFRDYLGFELENALQPADWLSFSEQRLLAVTCGKIYHDDVGLGEVCARFAYYPYDVWLYLLAAARPLAALFGLNLPAIFTVVGGVVLVYGLSLWLLAGRTAYTRFWVQVALALNIVWVVASFGGLLAGLFPVTTAGKWVIAILADLVLIIVLAQLYGLRRSQ